MNYTQPLPKLENFSWLARMVGPFPMPAGVIRRAAESLKLNKSVSNFLKLFPEDEEFESRADFLTRCEDLELIIREERNMQSEPLILSQED